LVGTAHAAAATQQPPPTSHSTAALATVGRPPAGIVCQTVARGTVNYVCLIGHSVQGRAIVAMRQGNVNSARVLVVNGQMHGEEWPGPLTVDALRKLPIPRNADFQVWTIRTINPDGGRLGHRFTSRGIDLNGNFPLRFKRLPRTGPRALSEPESVAMARFLTWVQPDLLISLHGFSQAVDTTGGGVRAAMARRFSSLSNITPARPVPCDGPCHGNMTDWYTATSRVRGVAFTVEMPHSSLVKRRCGVPAHRLATPIQCSAWAAVFMAARLPR
jgi:protein MpaA